MLARCQPDVLRFNPSGGTKAIQTYATQKQSHVECFWCFNPSGGTKAIQTSRGDDASRGVMPFQSLRRDKGHSNGSRKLPFFSHFACQNPSKTAQNHLHFPSSSPKKALFRAFFPTLLIAARSASPSTHCLLPDIPRQPNLPPFLPSTATSGGLGLRAPPHLFAGTPPLAGVVE